MTPKQPEIARPRHRLGGQGRDVIFAVSGGGVGFGGGVEDDVEFGGLEADGAEIKIEFVQALQFRRQQLTIPAGLFRKPIVGQHIGASAEEAAREAIALFNYRAVREIGSLAAALGGLDALVFTGGIGEHDAETRAAIVEQCGWLGARLDDDSNEAGEGRISNKASSVDVWVVPTDEERMMARHTLRVLSLV